MGIQHKGSGLWVSNTKDRDYRYPKQRIGIMGIHAQRIRIIGIQYKGSGL